jgi:hypothetical protein
VIRFTAVGLYRSNQAPWRLSDEMASSRISSVAPEVGCEPDDPAPSSGTIKKGVDCGLVSCYMLFVLWVAVREAVLHARSEHAGLFL